MAGRTALAGTTTLSCSAIRCKIAAGSAATAIATATLSPMLVPMLVFLKKNRIVFFSHSVLTRGTIITINF